MELDRAEKPLRQMRKLLKQLPSDPAPEDVHRLRTRARRIEAMASALEPRGGKKTKKLLKLIKPVRKAAGGVRDIDVLTTDLLNLRNSAHGESLTRLVEHLAAMRKKSAGNLLDAVSQQRKPGRRTLKQYARLIDSVAAGKKPVRREVARSFDSGDGAGSPTDRLLGELGRWPRLNARNLHPFRLKVKELRYVLQLFPHADGGLIDALGKVKDEIGDWHDWQQLQGIARQVLDAQKDKALLAQIDAAVKEKLAVALDGANALHRRYLHAPPTRRKVS